MQKYIVDTNFILRYLLADNNTQYEEAKNIFDQVREGKSHIILEQTVFAEVIFVLSSFYKIPKNKIIDIMRSLLSYKGLEAEIDLLNISLDIYHKHNIHIVDSIIAAKSQINSMPVLTFDKKLKRLL